MGLVWKETRLLIDDLSVRQGVDSAGDPGMISEIREGLLTFAAGASDFTVVVSATGAGRGCWSTCADAPIVDLLLAGPVEQRLITTRDASKEDLRRD